MASSFCDFSGVPIQRQLQRLGSMLRDRVMALNAIDPPYSANTRVQPRCRLLAIDAYEMVVNFDDQRHASLFCQLPLAFNKFDTFL